jgi:hypothetical protein
MTAVIPKRGVLNVLPLPLRYLVIYTYRLPHHCRRNQE